MITSEGEWDSMNPAAALCCGSKRETVLCYKKIPPEKRA